MKAGHGERRVFERRDREIPRAIYGTVIEILRTTGPAFAKHVRTRDLPSRKTPLTIGRDLRSRCFFCKE